MTDYILQISNLTKRFAAVQALDDVSLEIASGESVGLIGPNGSGKTTLFNCVAGFHQPSGGVVKSFGDVITGQPPQVLAARGLVRTFQQAATFASESVLWNVRTAITALPRRVGDRPEKLPAEPRAILEMCELDLVAHVRAGDLSYGQAKRLGVAMALGVQPRLLMLDEPASGLNDAESRRLSQILAEINRLGVGLLVVDHDMPFLMPLVTRVAVLDAGSKLTEGTPAEVRGDRRVIEAYLGHGFGNAKAGDGRAPAAVVTAGPGLAVDVIRSGYDRNDVVRDVSLRVRPGEAVAVLGANGAGKTTLLRSVSGVLPLRQGELSFGPISLRGSANRKRGWLARLIEPWRKRGNQLSLYETGLVHVPEGRHIFAGLSVRENMLAVRRRHGQRTSTEDLLRLMTEIFPVLGEKLDQPGESLSGGQQQMLAIARGLMAEPTLLCVDEPSLGLSPLMMETLTERIKAIQQRSSFGLLIVEQSATIALALSDRVYVMSNGQIVHEARSADITAEELTASYLGDA